jgi:hypothetical protein
LEIEIRSEVLNESKATGFHCLIFLPLSLPQPQAVAAAVLVDELRWVSVIDR